MVPCADLRASKRDWEAIVLERVWISLSGVNASEELRFKPQIEPKPLTYILDPLRLATLNGG